MSTLKQIIAVTTMGLRSVPARLGTSMVVVIGVAAVVAVLVSALAVATSFRDAAMKTGDPRRAIVLNADNEANSGFSRESALKIMDAPGLRIGVADQTIASAEVLEFVSLVDQHTGLNAYTTVRGVGRQVLQLRPELHLVQGRMFHPGAREVVVGRAVQARLGGLPVGAVIAMPNGDWRVVGAFESGGDSHESEILADAETLLNAYHHNEFNSVTVALKSPREFQPFAAALSGDPTLSVKAYREPDYFATASKPIAQLLLAIAYGIGGIMALGAVFSALNTLYSAVGTRTTEIATLRAIGFGAGPVVVSVMVEALALGLAGAFIGSGLAWLLLNGATVSAMTGVTPSQLTFHLRVSPALMLTGSAFAAVIVLIGGLLAAYRAARIPVATALSLT